MDVGTRVGAPNAHPKGRNEVEHSKRSGELCGRALVSQSSLRGNTGRPDVGFRKSAVTDYRRMELSSFLYDPSVKNYAIVPLPLKKKRTDLWCHTKPALNPQPSDERM